MYLPSPANTCPHSPPPRRSWAATLKPWTPPSLALSVETSRGTPVLERLNRMLGALLSRRPLYAQCWVLRQGSPSEVRGRGRGGEYWGGSYVWCGIARLVM